MTDPGSGSEHAHQPEHAEHDFTGPLSPGVALFIKVFVSIAIVLFLLDLVVDRSHGGGDHGAPEEVDDGAAGHGEGADGGHGDGHHSYVTIDGLPGFYAVYGFVGCVILVLLAKEMRKVVMRDERYYETSQGDADPGGDA